MKQSIVLALCLFLAACGGGSSSGGGQENNQADDAVNGNEQSLFSGEWGGFWRYEVGDELEAGKAGMEARVNGEVVSGRIALFRFHCARIDDVPFEGRISGNRMTIVVTVRSDIGDGTFSIILDRVDRDRLQGKWSVIQSPNCSGSGVIAFDRDEDDDLEGIVL